MRARITLCLRYSDRLGSIRTDSRDNPVWAEFARREIYATLLTIPVNALQRKKLVNEGDAQTGTHGVKQIRNRALQRSSLLSCCIRYLRAIPLLAHLVQNGNNASVLMMVRFAYCVYTPRPQEFASFHRGHPELTLPYPNRAVHRITDGT